jgi:hypothetical protein
MLFAWHLDGDGGGELFPDLAVTDVAADQAVAETQSIDGSVPSIGSSCTH